MELGNWEIGKLGSRLGGREIGKLGKPRRGFLISLVLKFPNFPIPKFPNF